MVSPMVSVPNIPKAPRATPNMPPMGVCHEDGGAEADRERDAREVAQRKAIDDARGREPLLHPRDLTHRRVAVRDVVVRGVAEDQTRPLAHYDGPSANPPQTHSWPARMEKTSGKQYFESRTTIGVLSTVLVTKMPVTTYTDKGVATQWHMTAAPMHACTDPLAAALANCMQVPAANLPTFDGSGWRTRRRPGLRTPNKCK